MSHIMLTSMGLTKENNFKEAKYELNGKCTDNLFSAFALWELLSEGNRPDKILFLLTPKAKESALSKIILVAEKHDVEIDFIDLPSEDMADDSDEFLRVVADAIPKGSQLTIDVTRGLRHHAFLFYALALYLGEFRDIVVMGAWYCRFEIGGREEAKPFINLKPVLDLSHWFHALGVFRETGSLRPLSKLVKGKPSSNPFEKFSSLFLTGMPLEAGEKAAILVEKLESGNGLLPEMPLIDEIQKKIIEELDSFRGAKIGKSEKSVLLFDERELERQAAYIDRYLEIGQLNLAFGLMREWVVNKVLLSSKEKSKWLDQKGRQSVEYMLGSMKAVLETKADPVRELMSNEQIEWARLWDHLTKTRNMLQHHGMQNKPFTQKNKSVKYLRKIWPELRKWSVPAMFGGGSGKLLICPMGQTPGVLYSALNLVQPDRCLIVCSKDTEASVDKACKQAEWSGDIEYLVMENPHAGFDEFKKLKRKASMWLFEADEVHAGLTGGTSLMGALVGELSFYAEKNYQRSVRKFVLIDKRSPAKQKENPWETGEIFYLENSQNEEAE